MIVINTEKYYNLDEESLLESCPLKDKEEVEDEYWKGLQGNRLWAWETGETVEVQYWMDWFNTSS